MPLTVLSLGSGSSGNALLIEADDTRLLVDCGVGATALTNGLASLGRKLADVTALLVSHEHADHVRSLGRVERAGVPLVSTRGTADAADFSRRRWEELAAGGSLRIGSLIVTALPVAHDAADPCGFLVEGADARVAVLTDLGRQDEALREPIAAADLIVLEANHDEAMLRAGPYPAHLKRRVLSDVGHLSNAACGDLLAASIVGSERQRTVWLAHLSQTNNRPRLAVEAVRRQLAAEWRFVAVATLPRHGTATWRSDAAVEPSAGGVQLALPGFGH